MKKKRCRVGMVRSTGLYWIHPVDANKQTNRMGRKIRNKEKELAERMASLVVDISAAARKGKRISRRNSCGPHAHV